MIIITSPVVTVMPEREPDLATGLPAEFGGPKLDPEDERRRRLRLPGGMTSDGSMSGTGTFSSALYTRCIAWRKHVTGQQNTEKKNNLI